MHSIAVIAGYKWGQASRINICLACECVFWQVTTRLPIFPRHSTSSEHRGSEFSTARSARHGQHGTVSTARSARHGQHGTGFAASGPLPAWHRCRCRSRVMRRSDSQSGRQPPNRRLITSRPKNSMRSLAILRFRLAAALSFRPQRLPASRIVPHASCVHPIATTDTVKAHSRAFARQYPLKRMTHQDVLGVLPSRWLPRPLIRHPYPEQRFKERHHSPAHATAALLIVVHNRFHVVSATSREESHR